MSQDILKAGVIGWPISHSLSPRLHGFWLDQLSIHGRYDAVPVVPEDLASFVRSLPENGFQGVNVTVPHKEAVMDHCDKIDDLALRIGAVNTLIVDDQGLILGSNTDHYGFKQNLLASGEIAAGPKERAAVVIGAGGASRAICTALEELGFPKIHLLNRTVSRAQSVARDLGGPILPGPLSDLPALLPDIGLLVNTSSLGMKGQDPLHVDLSDLPMECLVTDIVYNPLMTDLLRQARERGNKVVDGLGMLLYQAVPGFEAWFRPMEKPMVTDALRKYVLAGIA
ncbi:shikimate dehydrogenase [Aestuariispira insulae]|uniref:Shikimate dehydrogenase (NADP(+)) n=1 Tax=Aestuariispira insulae TaxID=1461337 RepID=A0A3D9HPE3_9PROT|nr:shikimate dehydrogenase [Aestuariispira insulae]RED51368.1 shikimate dehydrogenase [Aestuariispira insulae]